MSSYSTRPTDVRNLTSFPVMAVHTSSLIPHSTTNLYQWIRATSVVLETWQENVVSKMPALQRLFVISYFLLLLKV